MVCHAHARKRYYGLRRQSDELRPTWPSSLYSDRSCRPPAVGVSEEIDVIMLLSAPSIEGFRGGGDDGLAPALVRSDFQPSARPEPQPPPAKASLLGQSRQNNLKISLLDTPA